MKKKKVKCQYPIIRVDDSLLDYYANKYVNLDIDNWYRPNTFEHYLEMMLSYQNTLTGYNGNIGKGCK